MIESHQWITVFTKREHCLFFRALSLLLSFGVLALHAVINYANWTRLGLFRVLRYIGTNERGREGWNWKIGI